MRAYPFLISIFLFAALFAGRSVPAAEKVTFLRGSAARQAWDKPLQPRVEGISLREVLGTLCDNRKLAWMLDRRIDPDQQVSYTAGSAPLSAIVTALVEPLQAQAILLGDTVIVGPKESIQWLRTLAELQRVDLQRSGLPAARISQLSRPVTWHWEEASEPRKIVSEEVRRLSVEVQGLEKLPYDLWGSGSLVGLTPGEAITVIAWQYDQRLHWGEKGAATLVPIELPIAVSRVLPNFSVDREAVAEEFPELHLEPQGKSLAARGRVEEIEALEHWLKGATVDRSKKKPLRNDWRARKFTLKLESAPLVDVLELLKKQGLPLEWDAPALAEAGIDLKLKVSLQREDATADTLIEDLCRQAGLKSQADATRVVISR